MFTLVPAYGRDYKSLKELKAAWESDKDFQIAGIGPDAGRYVNRPQLEGKVTVRYGGLRKVAILKGGK